MSGMRSCPACGVVAPGRIGRCPSCGAWTGLGLAAVRLAAALAATIAVSALVWALRPGRGASPAMGVRVTSGGSFLSADERGTDVSATIDNPNPVPVNVTVRVRGYDITDRVVVEEIIGPFRHVPPGGPYPIRAHLETTPLKDVTLEAVDIHPSNPRHR